MPIPLETPVIVPFSKNGVEAITALYAVEKPSPPMTTAVAFVVVTLLVDGFVTSVVFCEPFDGFRKFSPE